MGYYYTAEPENAVPPKSWATPKTHVPGSPVKERGYRYYLAEIGRWVSRDPIEEKGYELLSGRPRLPGEIVKSRLAMRYATLPRWAAKQLIHQSLGSILPQAGHYVFCYNDPIDRSDVLGLVDAPPGQIPFPGGDWPGNYPTGPVIPSTGPQNCPEIGQCISWCNAGAAAGIAACATICLLAEEGWWVCFMPCARVFTQARTVCVAGCVISLAPPPSGVPNF